MSPKWFPVRWLSSKDKSKMNPVTNRKSWFTNAERAGFSRPNHRRICSAGIGFKGQVEQFSVAGCLVVFVGGKDDLYEL
ncbi:MAG TPA: hypothetical protein VLV84_06275 [Candidatus Acidoferrales bacterium]|nr:hypothetical protein [Candidatus Acidoferrales bacterium]